LLYTILCVVFEARVINLCDRDIATVFHVSLLRKAEGDPLWYLPQVPLEIEEELTLEVKSEKVLYHNEKELRSKKILVIQV
jgi:hypothetical protein